MSVIADHFCSKDLSWNMCLLAGSFDRRSRAPSTSMSCCRRRRISTKRGCPWASFPWRRWGTGWSFKGGPSKGQSLKTRFLVHPESIKLTTASGRLGSKPFEALQPQSFQAVSCGDLPVAALVSKRGTPQNGWFPKKRWLIVLGETLLGCPQLVGG